jgi:hypothetical protein
VKKLFNNIIGRQNNVADNHAAAAAAEAERMAEENDSFLQHIDDVIRDLKGINELYEAFIVFKGLRSEFEHYLVDQKRHEATQLWDSIRRWNPDVT